MKFFPLLLLSGVLLSAADRRPNILFAISDDQSHAHTSFAGYKAVNTPAFDRVDTWLLRAFAGFPRTQVPAFSKTKTPTRIFEMRDYESHSEERALSKMAMFDNGEIDVMKDLGMSPVFFGQAIAGPNLPHLRYITCAADLATHLANWKKFGSHPTWMKMKDDPQYKNNTSKNTARFLVPTSYSQL